MSSAEEHSEPKASIGTALASQDGEYLDADPVVLDLYGVTLDVLRGKRVGDFSPPQYAELERLLWSLWMLSGLEHVEGTGTVVRSDGVAAGVRVGLDRQSSGTVRITLRPVDGPVKTPTPFRIQDLLGHWRALERHLAALPRDDPARREIEGRIEALREEYQRRASMR